MLLLLQTYWPVLIVSALIGGVAGYLAFHPRSRKSR